MSIVIFLFGYTASPSPFCANDSWHVLPLAGCLGGSLRAYWKSLEDSKVLVLLRRIWNCRVTVECGKNRSRDFDYFLDKARSFIRRRGFCSNTETCGDTG